MKTYIINNKCYDPITTTVNCTTFIIPAKGTSVPLIVEQLPQHFIDLQNNSAITIKEVIEEVKQEIVVPITPVTKKNKEK